MKRRLGVLVAGSLAFWVAAAGVALVLWDEVAVVYSAVAAGLCLVPTVATLAWAGWGLHQSPEQQMVTVLGGTGVRMFFVLGTGLLLFTQVPYFHRHSFWLWILVFYLFTLALEMVLLVRGRPVAGNQGK